MTSNLYIGLMSGTSVDSIDVAVTTIQKKRHNTEIQPIATHTHTIPTEIKQRTLDLMFKKKCTIKELGSLDHIFGQLFADSVNTCLSKHKLHAPDIMAIGSHGQTIQHHPNINTPFTMQIGDPNIIAEQTNIPTIADFRRADMAASGQGAPLTPLFHKELFNLNDDSIILNIGGIANISVLGTEVTGFDTGPGNGLLDYWTQTNFNKEFDVNGEIANQGDCNQSLLELMLTDPYFKLPYPKSTGKEYFSIDWLNKVLNKFYSNDNDNNEPVATTNIKIKKLPKEDIQATLLHLTAHSIANSINKLPITPSKVIICGGGAYNGYLVKSIQDNLHKGVLLDTSLKFGIAPDWVEAMCFAWLAYKRIYQQKTNYQSITGARKMKLLGGLYLP